MNEVLGKGLHAENASMDVWDAITAIDGGIETIKAIFKKGRFKRTDEQIDLPYHYGITNIVDDVPAITNIGVEVIIGGVPSSYGHACYLRDPMTISRIVGILVTANGDLYMSDSSNCEKHGRNPLPA